MLWFFYVKMMVLNSNSGIFIKKKYQIVGLDSYKTEDGGGNIIGPLGLLITREFDGTKRNG